MCDFQGFLSFWDEAGVKQLLGEVREVAFVSKQNKASVHTDETSMKAASYAPDVLRKIQVEQLHLLQRLHQCMNVEGVNGALGIV